MPASKYYRSVIPTALLNVIGDMAGDYDFKLRFTTTKRRQFLGPIAICFRRRGPGAPIKLTKNHWMPRCLGNFSDVREQLVRRLSWVHGGGALSEFKEQMERLKQICEEPVDFVLRRYIKGERKIRLQ